jgi:hypothetical protein
MLDDRSTSHSVAAFYVPFAPFLELTWQEPDPRRHSLRDWAAAPAAPAAAGSEQTSNSIITRKQHNMV